MVFFWIQFESELQEKIDFLGFHFNFVSSISYNNIFFAEMNLLSVVKMEEWIR